MYLSTIFLAVGLSIFITSSSCRQRDSSSATSAAAAFDYASMSKSQRLDYYVANIGRMTREKVPAAERALFFKWRRQDLASLTKEERSAHMLRERNAQEQYEIQKEQEAFAIHCADRDVTIFDKDPTHLWNRVYRALYVRVDSHQCFKGFDVAFPYLFIGTEKYVEGSSLNGMLQVLDEFNANQTGSKLNSNLLAKALMQRSLLHVYHWAWNAAYEPSPVSGRDIGASAKSGAASLVKRLVPAIRSLALTASQIKDLPDNLVQAENSQKYQGIDPNREQDQRSYLPQGIANDGAGFSVLSAKDGPAAPTHFKNFWYSSAFFSSISIPGGPSATHDFINRLEKFSNKMIPQSGAKPFRNPATPQFPDQTRVALVSRAILLSQEGTAVVSPIVELVQARVYNSVGETTRLPDPGQLALEFELSQAELLNGDETGGLKPVSASHTDYQRFLALGDPLESGGSEDAVFRGCLSCHAQQDLSGKNNAAGIHTVHTYTRLLSGEIAAELIYRGYQQEKQTVEARASQQRSWMNLSNMK